MKRALIGFSVLSLIAATGLFEANARPQYAQKESKPCGYCHINPAGGGSRNFRGQFYGANGLSFASFDETREAALARVEANATGDDSAAKVAYYGSVTTAADRAITGLSNRSTVLVIFLDPAADDNAKAAAKLLAKSQDAFGRGAAVVGVVKGNSDAALKLTADLGNAIRVLPDVEGAAITKYKAEMGLDMVVVPKFDQSDPQPTKSFAGFSKKNIDAALEEVGNQGTKFEKPDTSSAPAKVVRGAKLSG